MRTHKVILKNLAHPEQEIVLAEWSSEKAAQDSRKQWRRVLGGKNWSVDRRPGLDTLDNLALTVEPIR